MLNTNSFDIMDTFKPKQDLARLERVRKQTTACFTIIAAAAVVVIIIFIIIYLLPPSLAFAGIFVSRVCVHNRKKVLSKHRDFRTSIECWLMDHWVSVLSFCTLAGPT